MTTFLALGVHIVDVLGRPVTHIPDGQGGALLTDMAITVAGTAGGTAVDLARLGGTVRSVGAVGEDRLGRYLRTELAAVGVDASGLVSIPEQRTSGTILPIRPNGERPALHLPGATASLSTDHVTADTFAGIDIVHVGGPDVLGEFAVKGLPPLLRTAREAGTVISTDLLTGGWDGLCDYLGPLLAVIDHLLINDQQAAAATGIDEPAAAAVALRTCGPDSVVVTRGAAGGVLVDPDGVWRFPALQVPVLDTTGCGDAFSAGYLTALGLGWSARAACGLGTACGALVAQVLGSDGIPDLDAALALIPEGWDRAVGQEEPEPDTEG